MSPDGTIDDCPPDPRQGRFDPLSTWLTAAVWAAAVLAVLTVIVPGRYTALPGTALMAVVVATPLLRTVWFAVRWARRGDRRFALVAVGVLAVVAAGVVAALLTT